MTAAGYISDQLCPSNPSHGKALDYAKGMHCPHAEHYQGETSQNFWTWNEWEALKSTELEQPRPQPRHRGPRKADRTPV